MFKRGLAPVIMALLCLVMVTGTLYGAEKATTAGKTKKQSKKGNPVVTIEMEKGGKIVFEMYPDSAPKTVAQITALIQKGFYNGLTFHRVVPGFVIQGGDPNGNGSGGSGKNIPAEFNSRKHLKGTVAMARAQDPNSADSQFYICLGPQPFLDNQYTVFGQVTEGQDVVDKVKVGDVMKKVTVTTGTQKKVKVEPAPEK